MMTRKIRNTIAATLYYLIFLIARILPAKKGQKHLVLIKTDEIGDYILFRNYFEDIRKSEKYKNYQITLIGNNAWKSLLEIYDAPFFDDVIWVNKKLFKRDLLYRFRLLCMVRKLLASEVINCVYSRSPLIDDGFAFLIKAKRITMKSTDVANRPAYYMRVDEVLYDTIVDAGDNRLFDNIRSGRFVSTVLGENVRCRVVLADSIEERTSVDTYVLFLGAGNPERKWGINHFLATADYLSKKYRLVPILCGGEADSLDAKAFVQQYTGKVHDYTGKTSLPEFINILKAARFLISVDTGAVHMAAAVKCPVIGLFSGKFYGRFAPYPDEVFDMFFPIYPDFTMKLISENNDMLYDTRTMKNDTIKTISATKVFPVIDQLLNK